MEDKKLNFNRPLLSVRRFSSRVSNSQHDSRRKNESSRPVLLQSPSYKSNLLSDPLRHPGSVPFVWEQSPGKPKDERKSQKAPIVPKLPPGGILKPKEQYLDVLTQGFYVTKDSGKEFQTSKDSKRVRSHSRDEDDGQFHKENGKPQFTNHGNEEHDSDIDYDEHENMSYNVCGLLPHFCSKGPIGAQNLVPGFSLRARLPISSANSGCVGSSPVDSQAARVAEYDNNTLVKHLEDHTVLVNESTEATSMKNSQKLQRSKLYDRLQGRGISNNYSPSSIACIPEKEELNVKGLVSFKELLAREDENEKMKEADPQNTIIEKTIFVDAVHKMETTKSNFIENDVGIFGIAKNPNVPFKSDLHAVKSKHDEEMIIHTSVCKYSKVDYQQVKVPMSELPASPPWPKSPSDTWLWRTLSSMSTKTSSLHLNRKHSSQTTKIVNKTIQSQYPKENL